jgi:MoxR-like ATPase
LAQENSVSPDLNPGAVRDTVAKLADHRRQILQEVRKIIVGQEEVVNAVLIGVLVGGHSLITGLPGMAKTLLIRTVSKALGLSFGRIQFTPDLMPADITGTEIVEEDPGTGRRTWSFVKGPIFAQVLLADEINRTPPKTQSALLEAMQEGSVTVRGKTYMLKRPFFVMATQNPIELEGTYPLPEAQLDRFLFNVVMDYLDENEEIKVVYNTTGEVPPEPVAVTNENDLLHFQELVRRIPVAESVARYAIRLVRSTRPGEAGANLDFINKYVSYGCSVRAAQFLVLAAKAQALLDGRFNVAVDDIRRLAAPVMRHRVLTNFHAEADKITTDQLIRQLLDAVPAPKSEI